MTPFIMLQPGCDRIFAAHDPRAGDNARCQPVGCSEIIWLVVGNRGKIRRDILANFFKIRFGESFNTSGDSLIAENQNGNVVLASNIDSFNGGVEAILNIGWRENYARTIP